VLPKSAPRFHDKAVDFFTWLGHKVCFPAGTPLRTPDGSRPIEAIRAGEYVLSRDEHDPTGPVVAKLVEEVFVRSGLVWHVHVGGQVIRTTAEHPFYVRDCGWVACHELAVGDRLLCEDGRWAAVSDLLDTGEWETVYNLKVSDFHTYFVGTEDWGFSVWAHNVSCAEIGQTAEHAARKALENRGHKVIGSIQNNSGHGIDLITQKGGVKFFWEVKGSTIGNLKLSPDQAKGASFFVNSRLGRAFGWRGMTAGELGLADMLRNEIRANGGKVYGGIIHIPDVLSGHGSTIRFLPWK